MFLLRGDDVEIPEGSGDAAVSADDYVPCCEMVRRQVLKGEE